MIDAIGGRKILAIMVMLALGIGAVLVKGDVPPNFLSLLQVLFGAFVVGNGIEHAATAYTSVTGAASTAMSDTTQPPAPDLTPVQASLVDLHTRQDTQEQALALVQQGIVTTNQALSLIIKKYGIADMPDPQVSQR